MPKNIELDCVVCGTPCAGDFCSSSCMNEHYNEGVDDSTSEAEDDE